MTLFGFWGCGCKGQQTSEINEASALVPSVLTQTTSGNSTRSTGTPVAPLSFDTVSPCDDLMALPYFTLENYNVQLNQQDSSPRGDCNVFDHTKMIQTWQGCLNSLPNSTEPSAREGVNPIISSIVRDVFRLERLIYGSSKPDSLEPFPYLLTIDFLKRHSHFNCLSVIIELRKQARLPHACADHQKRREIITAFYEQAIRIIVSHLNDSMCSGGEQNVSDDVDDSCGVLVEWCCLLYQNFQVDSSMNIVEKYQLVPESELARRFLEVYNPSGSQVCTISCVAR